MDESALRQPDLTGRDEELDRLKASLEKACEGSGSTILIAGEAGIGKTRIVTELVSGSDVYLINCRCLAESLDPLLPVKTGLREAGLFHLVSGSPPPKVVSVYLMNEAGVLIAKAERGEMGIDTDIFAGMLQAVGNFVQDSLAAMTEAGKGGLNTLGYQDYTILIQTRGAVWLAAVIKGEKCEFLVEDLEVLLAEVGGRFDDWDGDMDAAADLVPKMDWFITSGKYDGRFLVDDPKLKQENLFDNVLLGLQRQALENPTVLFLDDLQWADPSTLNLMHYLARNIRRNRVQILGTYRPEDIMESPDGRPHPLETTMRNMNREDLFDRLELRRLDRVGTEALIKGTLGDAAFDDDFFDRIHKGTEGTPLYVLEVVKLLVESGAIAREGDAWTLDSEDEMADIPSKVYDVVKRRLDRLRKGQRQLLECASVVGEEFSSDVLGTVLGVGKVGLLNDLGDLEKTHKLVNCIETGYRFDHAKIREVVYNGIIPELRMEYHRMVGDAVARLHDEEDVVTMLAYHYFEAGDERAPGFLLRAADSAKSRYANEEAMRFYRSALKVIKDPQRIGDIYENLGDLHFLCGEFESALSSFESALRIEKVPERIMAIHKKVATVFAKTGQYRESRDRALLGLEVQEKDCIEKAQLLEAVGWASVRLGDYERASEVLKESLRIAEGAGDETAIALAHHSIGTASLNKGEFDQALEHLRTALELREKVGDALGQSATLNNIGVVYWNKGDMDRALEFYERSLNINEMIGHKWGVSSAYNNIGLVHQEKGELDPALEYFLKSKAMDEKLGDKSGIASSLNNIGNTYNRKGDIEASRRSHARSLELRESIGDKAGIASSHINLGNVCMAQDSFEKASEHFSKALDISTEIGDKWVEGHVRFSLAESTLALGDTDTALTHAEDGLALSSEIGARREEGMNLKALGMVYREKGDFTLAEAHFARALAIFEAIEDKNVLMRLYYEMGLLAKAENDKDKAGEFLNRAREMSENMGMRLWSEKCRKGLDSL